MSLEISSIVLGVCLGLGLAAILIAWLESADRDKGALGSAPTATPAKALACVFMGEPALCEAKPNQPGRAGFPSLFRFYSAAGRPLWVKGEGWTPTIFKSSEAGLRALPSRRDLVNYETGILKAQRESDALEGATRAPRRAEKRAPEGPKRI